ncbi:unnamed protein product, partial [Sphacelaria rigidula]
MALPLLLCALFSIVSTYAFTPPASAVVLGGQRGVTQLGKHAAHCVTWPLSRRPQRSGCSLRRSLHPRQRITPAYHCLHHSRGWGQTNRRISSSSPLGALQAAPQPQTENQPAAAKAAREANDMAEGGESEIESPSSRWPRRQQAPRQQESSGYKSGFDRLDAEGGVRSQGQGEGDG